MKVGLAVAYIFFYFVVIFCGFKSVHPVLDPFIHLAFVVSFIIVLYELIKLPL